MNTRKLSSLSLFSILLFSQSVFSDYQDDKKLLTKVENEIKSNIEEFISRDKKNINRKILLGYFGDLAKATNNWLSNFEKKTTFETETSKKEWAWKMEENKNFFLKRLAMVNCRLSKECNNSKKNIINHIEQYYKLAKKIATYFPIQEIQMPTIKNEKEILKYWEEIKAKENYLKKENYQEIPFEKMKEEKSLMQKLYKLIDTYHKRAEATKDLLTQKMKIMLNYFISSEGCKRFLEVNFESLLKATNKKDEIEKEKTNFLKKLNGTICQGISKKSLNQIEEMLKKGYTFALDRYRLNKEAFELEMHLNLRKKEHEWHLESKQQSSE